MTLISNLASATDAELEEAYNQLLTEINRRRTVKDAAAQAQAIADNYATAIGRKNGDPWKQPTGAHDAYAKDAEVSYNGKVWVSLTAANVWQPGVSSWREKTADASNPPAWVQPTGATDAYKKGDRVTFQGATYESLIDANTYSPTAYPAGWKKL